MAGQKFLQLATGGAARQEVTATQLGGSGNENKIPALDSTGKFDNSMMPSGMGPFTIVAGETVASGDIVNIYNDSGTPKVRKADATTSGKYANGFVMSNFNIGATATVYLPSHQNSSVTSLTVGTVYYLSTTAGAITATAPSATGNVVQVVGYSTTATNLIFYPGTPTILA
jgi:hypothetical protein